MSGDAGASGSGSGGGGSGSGDGGRPSRYESQKRRDWNTFVNYLHNYSPAVGVGTCTGMHVVDFLRYLDQFGKTKVHVPACAFFGRPNPAGPCACPLRQAWGSLDALVGRLRAAFDEHSAAALANVHNNTNTTGNNSNNNNNNSNNPFAARPVRQYLRDVRDLQSRARGISYHKKKRRNPIPAAPAAQAEQQQQQQQLQRQPHLHTRGYATSAAAAAAADEISSGSSSADVDAPAPAPAPPSATASYMMTMHGLR